MIELLAFVVGAGIMLASTWLANFIYGFRTPVDRMTGAGRDDAHALGVKVGFILAITVALIIVHVGKVQAPLW